MMVNFIYKHLMSATVKSILFVPTLTLLIAVIACTSESDPLVGHQQSVILAVSRTPLSAPFYVAQENGYFAREGVEAKLHECIGGHRCLKQVLNASAHMGTASDSPIMFNSFDRDDYTIIATFVSSYNDVKLIARKDAGIVMAADLRGKKIGTVKGASSHFFLDTILLFNNVNPDEVMVVHMQPDEMVDAMIHAEVAAVSVWEPFGYMIHKALGDSSVILPSPKHYRETFNLVARKDYVLSHMRELHGVVRALYRSINFINKNERNSQQILIDRLGLDEGFITWIWPDFNYDLTLDQALLNALESQARWAVDNNHTQSSAVPNYLNYLNTDVLDQVNPDAVTIVR